MQKSQQNVITPAVIADAMDYDAYRQLIDDCLKEDQTTGSKQSEALTEYTRLNRQRMNRLDKTVEINDSLKEKLKKIPESWIWLVLTEGWCGDAAQNVPVINKMAELAPKIELKLILRTENTDIMDEYLTKGGRSIPKLVCLHADTLDEIGTWGPRPSDFQEKALEWKDDPNISHEEWAEKLHKWYAKDKSQTIQDDFEKLLDEWT
ncbi:MAG TPA: thioredoxin family protein [Balneolaceae bacterium]|nr:thioredoxin family protein [Balneolaceae bacterium]